MQPATGGCQDEFNPLLSATGYGCLQFFPTVPVSPSFAPCEMTIHSKMYPSQRIQALVNLLETSQFTLSPAQIIFGGS